MRIYYTNKCHLLNSLHSEAGFHRIFSGFKFLVGSRYDAKRVVLRQGHEAEAFYFILSGSGNMCFNEVFPTAEASMFSRSNSSFLKFSMLALLYSKLELLNFNSNLTEL